MMVAGNSSPSVSGKCFRFAGISCVSSKMSRVSSELTRFIPDLTRIFLDLARIFPDLARIFPELTRKVPELTRFIPDLTRFTAELTRKVPDIDSTIPNYVLHTIPALTEWLFIKQNTEKTHSLSVGFVVFPCFSIKSLSLWDSYKDFKINKKINNYTIKGGNYDV